LASSPRCTCTSSSSRCFSGTRPTAGRTFGPHAGVRHRVPRAGHEPGPLQTDSGGGAGVGSDGGARPATGSRSSSSRASCSPGSSAGSRRAARFCSSRRSPRSSRSCYSSASRK
jgi:hypothetical protein